MNDLNNMNDMNRMNDMNEINDLNAMLRRDFLKCGFAAAFIGLTGFAVLASTTGCGESINDGAFSDSRSANALKAERWALVVDVQLLNKSANFSKIADACHKNHNVPRINDPKTEVKWIWEDDFEHCFAEMNSEYLSSAIKKLRFPMLCNHCENPACVRVCPTQATFKRPDGIVDMDYHRCIGCRFCMTACPYNARSLNFSDPRAYLDEISPNYPTRARGVVEKCNFCVERLNKGLPPYCVEASQGAILFGDLKDSRSDVRRALAGGLSIRRLAELGTGPSVYYLLDGKGEADFRA